jgi:hypothetical protein
MDYVHMTAGNLQQEYVHKSNENLSSCFQIGIAAHTNVYVQKSIVNENLT